MLDPLNAQLSGETWTCAGASGGTCTAAGTGAIDDTAGIPAGGQVTYRLTATVKPTAAGDLSNVVQVTPPTGELDPGCDPNCLGTSVEPEKARVDLTVTKTSAPSPYIAGHRLTYTVTVANGGPDDAVGVRVSDPLPAALAAGAFTWTCDASRGSVCTPAGTGTHRRRRHDHRWRARHLHHHRHCPARRRRHHHQHRHRYPATLGRR